MGLMIITETTNLEKLIQNLRVKVELDELSEVHLWADAERLPEVAAAMAGVDKLPEDLQLHQI